MCVCVRACVRVCMYVVFLCIAIIGRPEECDVNLNKCYKASMLLFNYDRVAASDH